MTVQKLAPERLLPASSTEEGLIQRVLINHYRKVVLEAFMGGDDETHRAATERLKQILGPRPNRGPKSGGISPQRKHSPEAVRAMREMYAQGFKPKEISDLYRVPNSGALWHILQGNTYREV